MKILAYFAEPKQQQYIKQVVAHSGAWQNTSKDFYCIIEPNEKTLTTFSLLGIDYWYENL